MQARDVAAMAAPQCEFAPFGALALAPTGAPARGSSPIGGKGNPVGVTRCLATCIAILAFCLKGKKPEGGTSGGQGFPSYLLRLFVALQRINSNKY